MFNLFQGLDNTTLGDKLKELQTKREEAKKNTETVFGKDGKKITLDDFDIIKVLGRGAFGKVMNKHYFDQTNLLGYAC